jgi:Domain of unknown function (DUF4397)
MPNRRINISTLVLALCLGGCASDSNGPADTARIRLVHAAAGAPSLDLVVGGQLVLQGVAPAQVSSFAESPAGSQTLSLRSAGNSAVLSTLAATLQAGAEYTVMVTGSTTDLTPAVVADTGQARPDRAHIRLINVPPIRTGPDSASPLPPLLLDVYITAPDRSPAEATPNLQMDANIASYSSLLYFDPGTYLVRYTRAGTTTVETETAALAIGAGEVQSVTLFRRPDGSFATSIVRER